MSESNANLEIGAWVQPAWSGHAFYGQTAQITGLSPSETNWLMDADGDGVTDYYLALSGQHNNGSFVHMGMMGDQVNDVSDYAIMTFNIIIPIVLAVCALGILTKFAKRVKGS